jgi:hypothetical protein
MLCLNALATIAVCGSKTKGVEVTNSLSSSDSGYNVDRPLNPFIINQDSEIKDLDINIIISTTTQYPELPSDTR